MTSSNDLFEKITNATFESYRAATGFDAVADCVVRAIKSKDHFIEYFDSMKQFGDFISSRSGLNGLIPLKRVDAKFGGNMVNCANALGRLGVTVECVGTFGLPVVDPIFDTMSENCRLHSVGAMDTCTAMEFSDGKIMLADMSSSDQVDWKSICNRLGYDTVISLFANSELICLANWSEIINSTDIWQGVIRDCVDRNEDPRKQLICIDVTDFSSRAEEDVDHLLDFLRDICPNHRVLLSVNQNEAKLFYTKLFADAEPDIVSMGEALYAHFTPDYVVIHNMHEAIMWHAGERVQADTFFVERPAVLTGSGDNFNAGLCTAILAGLNPKEALVMANAVAACYVQNGISPNKEELVHYLESKLKEQNA